MRHLKYPGFRTKLLAMICLFSVLMVLLVSFFNYHWYSRQLTEQTISKTQQIIEQTGVNISSYLNELNRLTLAPYYNDFVLESLDQTAKTPEEQLNFRRTVEDFLASTMTLPRDEILRVYILTGTETYSYTRTPYEMSDYSSYLDSSWYREALTSTKPIYIPPHFEKAFGDEKTPVFSVVRQLRSKQENQKFLGIIKVDADYTGIRKICDQIKLEKRGALFVLDETGQTIYQTDKLSSLPSSDEIKHLQNYGSHFFQDEDGQKYILNSYDVESSGLTIIALNSYDELMSPLKINLERTVLLAFFCTLLIILFFSIFTKRFLAPLSEIIQLMREIEKGNLNVHAVCQKQDEIGYLAVSFNKMTDNLNAFIQKNNRLVREVYETQYLYKESQYNALYSQIKPHFMYNTLNTISLLIKCGEHANAVRAIEAFSCFLNGIMNIDREIRLIDEVKICEAYLSIMQLRYEDRLTYHIDVDEASKQYLLPSLSIQPLVENAVKYGCEPKRTKTQIEIIVCDQKDYISISVSDDGPGMSPDLLHDIHRQINNMSEVCENKPEPLTGKIGLINICRRLFLKFGKEASFHISSDPSAETVVTINIPKMIHSKET